MQRVFTKGVDGLDTDLLGELALHGRRRISRDDTSQRITEWTRAKAAGNPSICL